MSGSEALVAQYSSPNHTQYHDGTPMNGETSSTTSSETESQFAPPVKGGQPNGPIIENGPDVYQSDSSIDSGQSQPGPYINGPMHGGIYQPCEYDTHMEGQMSGYSVPAPEYDGNQNLEYPSPTQEYIPQDQLYANHGTEYVDYNQGQQQMVGQVGDDAGQSPNSAGSPPQGTNPGEKQKYVFYLHIKQGEAFPVENGDQVRYIHGPTMVQLVSPSPNPPSIHMVQTGLGPVNNVGTGTIPLHPAPLPPTTMHMQPPMQDSEGVPPAVYNTGTGTVPQPMYPPMYHQPPGPGGGGVYPHLVAGFPPSTAMPPHMHPQGTQMPGLGTGHGVVHHHPPHVHVQRYPPGAGPSSHASSHHASNIDHSNRHEPSHRPLLLRSRSRDDRTEKQREKLQRKLHDRRKENGGYISSPQTSPRGNSSSSSRGSSTSPRENRSTSHRPAENGTGGRAGQRRKRQTSTSPRNGEAEDIRKLTEILSTLKTAEVFDITSRTAFAKWQPPTLPSSEERDDRYLRAGLSYEVQLSDKGKGGSPKTFQTHVPSWHMDDLKPATEYNLRVCAISDNVKGSLSEPAIFSTLGCPPDVPSQPSSVNRTKNSLLIKWFAPASNGSKIHTYILQCHKGDGYSESKMGFTTVYEGPEKQHKVTRLQPSTCYRFRVQAANSHGASGFSEEARIFTSGSVPPQQEPPTLVESTARTLKLQWQTCTGDVTGYVLEMEEKYGFQPAYRGDETSYTCKCLARNSEYKFRLCAFNDEGNGRWSTVVAFRTSPDTPRAPSRPCLKGKIHSNSFRVTWEPPRDTGGSEITSYSLELCDASDGVFSEVYRGLEKEHLCTDLRPGVSYKVRVSCTSRGGVSPFSDVCLLTTLPVCPGQCPPPRLHGRPKAVSLNLRWSLPEYDGGAPITEFSVEMTAADQEGSTREVHRGPVDVTECCVNDLLPGKVYSFKVQALNKVGAGPFSEPLQITTGAGPPDRPKNLQATFKSPTSACVSWEMPCNNGAPVTEYKLEKASDNGSFGLAYTGPSTSCELRSLRPATYYYLRVQAINLAGPGLFSDVTSCTTPSSSPEVVPSLRVISSTSDSLLLKWTEPNNCGEEILAYNIQIGKDQSSSDEGKVQTIVVEGNVTEYCIDQLEADTKYKIKIQAVNNKGAGPYSATLKSVTQALPPPPPRLECSVYGHQSLKLKWVHVSKVFNLEGKSINYCLEMEDRKGKYSIVYSGVNTNHKVSRLSENTIYKFRICASNEAGNGQYSEEYSFSTLKAPPAVMKAPTVSDVTETSVLLSWATLPPLQEDKIVYQCQCLKGRENDNKQIIYRGEDSSYLVQSLEPNSLYGFRVCAIRIPADESPELVGVYSPWGMVHTSSNRQSNDSMGSGEGKVSQSGKKEWKSLEDQQVAAIIMLVFLISAIVIAIILQYLVS
ncbi:Fibronectin type-III domain-containing protein 3A [Holothuria leucospilota]|uniref:Fibronectin type-III domain-containing protein 3A n=1 Tax=Holothuria leucospilota TaxID=206669 RepID=A0A9Q1H1S5_HOLLE|nr:Fibronectin type-III domain-containing protein 3A [Holothuria leucospilota]